MKKSLIWAIISVSLLLLSAVLVYYLGKIVRKYEYEKRQKETREEQINEESINRIRIETSYYLG